MKKYIEWNTFNPVIDSPQKSGSVNEMAVLNWFFK